MGLSASQARLLSITARLSDNELRSQTITTAKMSLANKTSEASREYINALNETELKFATYDENGNKTYTNLTGTCLTQYGILKNQYGIINPQGQIMVSEIDGANYLDSATMGEFLEKYGVANVEDVQKDNPAYIDQGTLIWGSDWKSWVATGEGTPGGLIAREPQQKDFNMVEEVPNTNNEIYKAVTSSGGCLGGAISGSCCYMHVLSDLIGPGEVTTSDGHTYTVVEGGNWAWNSAKHGVDKFAPITEQLKNAYCSGDEIEGGSETVTTDYGTVTVG